VVENKGSIDILWVSMARQHNKLETVGLLRIQGTKTGIDTAKAGKSPGVGLQRELHLILQQILLTGIT
jgi:hypothetical protein